MIHRHLAIKTWDDVCGLIDQLFVIASRTDGRLAGLILQLGKNMEPLEEFEFRKAVFEYELSRLEIFIEQVAKDQPEIANRMNAMFNDIKGCEKWMPPKRSA